jgi:hypothetical protein
VLDAVGVHAAEVGVHEVLGYRAGVALVGAGGLKEVLDPGLEVSGGFEDHLHSCRIKASGAAVRKG